LQSASAGALGDLYEGASRSGHFDGVVTVVARLFQLVRPKTAIFGEKDFQQLTLIRKLITELKSDIEIVAAPTIREDDGLAMSSRNVRLDEKAREQAQVLYRALSAAALSLDLDTARTALQSVASSQEGFDLDYAEIIDEKDFSKAVDATVNKRAIIAGWLNGVRLIDNMEMKLGAVR
jgi:pantoate--beta-alanine ligase